jgi:catechol 2,3-dioxygenase-like lactoylglutathione lyase family enzyme
MTKLVHNGVGIHIKCAGLAASRTFYEDVLDLVPVFGYGSPAFRGTLPKTISSVTGDGLPGAPERYCGVVYEPAPQSPIEVAEGHIAVTNKETFSERILSPKISAMMRVASLLPLVRDKAIRPRFPVRHYYWGTLELALRDPDGFVIVVIAPYSEKEFAELNKYVRVEVVRPD